MLSNTATPKYYGIFRDAVIRGEFPVCETISMQMNRIDERIADPYYYYDDQAVEGWIAFCDNELTLTDGSDMELLLSFKIWGEDVFGWYYFVENSVYVPDENGGVGRYVTKSVKKRLTLKQYLIIARGGGKSIYASTIQQYFLTVDTSTTFQVTTAPTLKQAEEVLAPIRTAIVRARGPYYKFLTYGTLQNTTGGKLNRPHLASTKDGIKDFYTNSVLEARPMSIDKLQGLKPKCSTVDEWLSGEIREDVIGALEQGASKLEDYLILATSSEGTVRNGPGDTIKMELMEILRGDYKADHVSIWYYQLDDTKEVARPDLWIKANPNIGKIVSYEAYQRDKERAEKNPSVRNEILAKRFGIPSEGHTFFFTYDETLVHRRNPNAFLHMCCAMGADFSRGDDFCAFTFLFPIGSDAFGVKTRCYITQDTLNKLPGAMYLKYQEFIEEGSLIVLEGVTLEIYPEIYEDVMKFIESKDYEVRCFGYDPNGAQAFVAQWEMERGPFGVEVVRQGARTESVPLGELKKLAQNRDLVFDEKLMEFCMGNCVAIIDTNGNRKLSKPRHELKIDAVAAMMDAFVAYKLNTDMFE